MDGIERINEIKRKKGQKTAGVLKYFTSSLLPFLLFSRDGLASPPKSCSSFYPSHPLIKPIKVQTSNPGHPFIL